MEPRKLSKATHVFVPGDVLRHSSKLLPTTRGTYTVVKCPDGMGFLTLLRNEFKFEFTYPVSEIRLDDRWTLVERAIDKKDKGTATMEMEKEKMGISKDHEFKVGDVIKSRETGNTYVVDGLVLHYGEYKARCTCCEDGISGYMFAVKFLHEVGRWFLVQTAPATVEGTLTYEEVQLVLNHRKEKEAKEREEKERRVNDRNVLWNTLRKTGFEAVSADLTASQTVARYINALRDAEARLSGCTRVR